MPTANNHRLVSGHESIRAEEYRSYSRQGTTSVVPKSELKDPGL